MSYGVRALFEDLRSRAFGSITANFQTINTAAGVAGLENPTRLLIIKNTTDGELEFSHASTLADSTTLNPKFVLSSLESMIIDFSSNRVQDYPFFFAKGDAIFVRNTGGALSSGNAYVSVIYGRGD